MKKIILLMSAAILTLNAVKAQSVGPSTLNATGGSATIGGNEFEWSVGEMTMVSTFSTSSIVVTQGVLQPSDASVGVPVTHELLKTLKVYPNPATDFVNLQYTSANNGTLSCKLLDMNGKEISSQKIVVVNGQATGQVDVKVLAAATYMLEVTMVPTSGTPETTTYKIQKLK